MALRPFNGPGSRRHLMNRPRSPEEAAVEERLVRTFG